LSPITQHPSREKAEAFLRSADATAHISCRAGGTLSRTALMIRFAAALAFLTAPCVAQADVVTHWNSVAETVATRFGGRQPQSRVLAIVQIAVHDALNAIEPRYVRYAASSQAETGASPDAAVASASRRTMLTLRAVRPELAAVRVERQRLELQSHAANLRDRHLNRR
jgi:hypothetical protein